MRTPAPPRGVQLRRRAPLIGAATAVATSLVLALASSAAAEGATLPAASPAPQLTSGPASPDNDLAPRWSFSAPEIATFECSLTRDATLVGDWAPCVSPTAYDISSQPDGVYTFAVRSRGADGVVSQPATSVYTLDTTVPALPTIVALPGPAAADRSPDWTFTGGAGEAFECRVDRAGAIIADWAPCSSPHQVDLIGEPDGSYLFSIRGVAADGTFGPVRTDGYVLDTSVPAAPEISSSPPPVGNGQSATLAFNAEPEAQIECRASTDGIAAPDWAPCTSPYTYDLGGRPDGTYTLAMRATDAAGNTGPEAVADYTLDTTPPEPPAVDEPSVSPATMLQPAFRFADDPAYTYECRLDGPGGHATGWQPCASPAPYDLTGQPDGAYTFAVRGTDPAGNTGDPGSATYELSRDPDAVDLRAGPGRTGSNRQPRWSFEVTGGSRFVCSLQRGSVVVFKPSTCGSPRSYDLSGKPDGTYVFTVRATGDDDVAHEPATQEYELDSTAPPRPAVTTTPVSPAADATPAWRFSGEDGAALDCRVTRGQATVVEWTSCTNPKPFDLGGASDGDYRVTVRARDAAGNVSTPATSDYALDSTAPAAPTLSAAPNSDDIDRSPTWAFSGENEALFTCTLTRESQVVASKSSCATAKTYNLSGAQSGTYMFAVEATDAAGNTSRTRLAKYVLAAAPASGSTGSGNGGAGDSGLGSGGGGTDPGSGPTPAGTPPAGGGSAEPSATGGNRTPTTSSGPDAPGPQGPSATAGGSPSSRGPTRPAPTGGRGGAPRAAGGASQDARSGGDRSRHGRGVTDALKDAIGGATRETKKALTGDVAKAVFPMSILIILGGFLLVQSRIDRGDPKLALAPIDADPDLEFRPPPTRR